EEEAVRAVLVDMLADTKGPTAGAALAQRALFDLSPRLRERALQALAGRPAEEHQAALLEGFRHPWPAVADHAAEAVVALGLTKAVPEMRRRLAQADPLAPYEGAKKVPFVREVVKVHHGRNCLMCHAPSFSPTDPVRRVVPELQLVRRPTA